MFAGWLQHAMPQIAAMRAAQGIAPGPLQMAMGLGGAQPNVGAQELPIVQPPSAAPGFGVGIGAPGVGPDLNAMYQAQRMSMPAAPDYNAILGQNQQLEMAKQMQQRQSMLQRMQQHFSQQFLPQGGQPGMQAPQPGMQPPQGFGAGVGGTTHPAGTAALPVNHALQGYGAPGNMQGFGQVPGVPTVNPTRTPNGPANY
jgi:hypothetical protein